MLAKIFSPTNVIAGGGNLLGNWEGVTELGMRDFLLASHKY